MSQRWKLKLVLFALLAFCSVAYAQTSVGLGGGGSIYAPAVAPYDPNTAFVACDMTGLYRTTDGGLHWKMMDQHQAQGLTVGMPQGTLGFSVAFDPATPGHIVGTHPAMGLVESFNTGDSWNAFSPAVPGFVISATFSPDNPSRLLVSTTSGVYELQSGVWQRTLTDTSVFKVIFVKDPSSGRQVAYAGANGNFYQQAANGTWQSLSSGLPFGVKQVYDIAGGADATHYALYVTFSTDVSDISSTGGVYRYASNSPSWSRQVSGLNGANGTIVRDPDCDGGGDAPQYKFLGLATGTPDSAYVTSISTTCGDSVWKGTFSGQMNWTSTYDGFQNHLTTTNLTGGWSDEPKPLGLDWGFGGSANGFAVAPSDFNTAVFVNESTVDVTTNGGSHWNERYTTLISGTAGNNTARWQTNGVDVTTSWNYYADPDPAKTNIHFIANTDIGLARSEDSGNSWENLTFDGSNTWGNWYQLAFEYPAGSRIWAGVSAQHDIPQETQLNNNNTPIRAGKVLVSSDDGASWTPVGGSGLPSGPVVSLIYNAGTLYASVWGSGVYKSTDAGATWSAVGSFTNKHVYQLRFDANGNLYVVVAADNTGASFVAGGFYKLVSGSWQKLSSGLETLLAQRGASLAPYDFLMDPTNSDLIYLCAGDVPRSGGGFGVYKYSLSANTWTDMGLQNAVGVASSQVAFAPFLINGTFYVTTMGDGIWQTTNGGSTWTEYKGIPFMSPQRMTLIGSQIYITTFGGGVWKPGTAPPPPPPPTVSMTAPTAGSTVSGTITLSATASDSTSGVAGVTFLVDGTVIGSEITAAPYTTSFDTTTLTNASHTFTARARNNANVTATSAGDTVTVNNPTPPPPPQLTLTVALALSPASPLVNQSTTATFTVQNTGGSAITVQSFVAAARDPSNANVDFPATGAVTLQPAQSYSYSASRSFATAGGYSSWPSWFDGTTWHNLDNPTSFTVQNPVTDPVLFSDNFNRTTGLGANWSVFAGSFTTDGSMAVAGTMTSAGSGNWAKLTTALGTDNYAVAADMIVPASSLDSGLVARSNDSVNFDSTLYSAQIATDGHVNLYRRNAWTWTLLNSVAATITAGTSYNLKLITTGSNPVHLEVWLNGAQEIVFDDNSASRITTGVPGMQNYDTNVKYDNFTVTAPVLFSDNFNRTTGLGANWSVAPGSFTTDGSMAVAGTMTSSGSGNWAKVVPDLNTNNYAVSADMIVPAGSLDSGLVARSNDSVNFDSTLYSAQIATDGHVNLYRRNAYTWTLLSSVATTITAGTSYNLKLIVNGSSPVHLEVWLNGVQKVVFDDSSTSQIATGVPGLQNYDTNVKYDNFTVQ